MGEIRVGDIIVIESFDSNGVKIGRHSFVVINTENGIISGLDYDYAALLMSSFKNEEQKEKKLNYPGNFLLHKEDEQVKNGHGKEGYIKADQLYYFKKEKTQYFVIGRLTDETLENLMVFIRSLKDKNIETVSIISNL